TQLGMAAKPDYPTSYLPQMIYPFTHASGRSHKPFTTATTADGNAPIPPSGQGSTYRL
ncbi:MAG: sterol desaturase family protein, partial [Dietzia sp.]|nr:sterol desaturase family protein [Dietzia sp.]